MLDVIGWFVTAVLAYHLGKFVNFANAEYSARLVAEDNFDRQARLLVGMLSPVHKEPPRNIGNQRLEMTLALDRLKRYARHEEREELDSFYTIAWEALNDRYEEEIAKNARKRDEVWSLANEELNKLLDLLLRERRIGTLRRLARRVRRHWANPAFRARLVRLLGRGREFSG